MTVCIQYILFYIEERPKTKDTRLYHGEITIPDLHGRRNATVASGPCRKCCISKNKTKSVFEINFNLHSVSIR